jgi:putative spermidine/putrescine transport system substrate-binding protein
LSDAAIQYYGTGRRKTSAARIYLRPGRGEIVVNTKTFDEYFPNEMLKMIIRQPLVITETADKFDVLVRVSGGGPSGQAGALRHGIARALLEYNPDAVQSPPTTPAELLAWCKDHKDRFIYARPANSGPGRTFLMGLPYLLGDKDPKDPVNGWDKTWAYLKELDACIEYYPSGTSATMKEFGEGSRDMTVTVTGWDINPRALGIVPEKYKVAAFKDMTWVNDTQYMIVPKGLAPDKLAVVLDLMAFLLEPEQQAMTYDKGYFYPGPAINGVTLAMAPKASQDVIKQFGRPEYDDWLARFPHQRPLEAKAMVAAFHRWDEEVGAQKAKK